MKKKIKKPVGVAVAAATLLAGAIGWYWNRPAPAPHYVTVPVVVRDLESSVAAVGTIQPADLVSVGAEASGQIKSMDVKVGQAVKKGDLIAEIDSTPQVNALRTAQAQLLTLKAQLQASEATLTLARLQNERQQDLFSHDAGSRQDYEIAQATFLADRANVAALRSQLTSAQIAVDTARVTLGYTKIIAPSDGVVVAVLAVQGQTVNANQTTPNIVKLANLKTVTVKAQISEADVIRLKPGMPAYFTILGDPDKRYETTLRAIQPAPDSINTDTLTPTTTTTSGAAVYYNGLLDVPNTDGRLRISMTAQVTIVFAKVRHAKVIPISALLPGGHGSQAKVRVLDKTGHAVVKDVRTGIDDSTSIQVLDGLSPGDRVIVAEGMPTASGRLALGGV